MKMRDLEKKTGVHRETIRTYLRHGLIPEPERPKPNSANYNDDHVRAVVAVRNLQKANSLTLPQIEQVLAGRQLETNVPASAFQDLEALIATRIGVEPNPILLKSMVKAMPHAEEDAREMAKVGLIDVVETPDGQALSMTDYRLVAIWSEMRSAGFTEEFGITAAMTRFYLGPAETLAAWESSMFLNYAAGKVSDEKGAEMLHTALRLMLDYFGLIRTKKFMENIRRQQGGGQQNEISNA